jgi:hypothetical protein
MSWFGSCQILVKILFNLRLDPVKFWLKSYQSLVKILPNPGLNPVTILVKILSCQILVIILSNPGLNPVTILVKILSCQILVIILSNPGWNPDTDRGHSLRQYTLSIITSQLHCFQVRTTLNRKDFLFNRKNFFSWAMHREAEHPSSTQA